MTAEIVELSRQRRETLFAVAELEPPVTALDIDKGSERVSYATAREYLAQLTEHGLIHRVGPLEGVGDGRNPIGYRLTDAARKKLEQHVQRRVEQLGGNGTHVEVLEQRETSADRVLDDPFCTGCGAVYAGDGYCPDCRDERELEEDLVA